MRSHTCASEAQKNGYLSDVIPIKVPKVDGFVDKDNGIRLSTPEQVEHDNDWLMPVTRIANGVEVLIEIERVTIGMC